MSAPNFVCIAAGLVLAEGAESINSTDDIVQENELIVINEAMESLGEAQLQEHTDNIVEALENAFAAGVAFNTQTISPQFRRALIQAIIDAAANDELDRGDGLHNGNLGDIFDRAEKAFLSA